VDRLPIYYHGFLDEYSYDSSTEHVSLGSTCSEDSSEQDQLTLEKNMVYSSVILYSSISRNVIETDEHRHYIFVG
jgi:hypothetical protein